MSDTRTPREIRGMIASGQWVRPTTGLAPAYAQANLVILNRRYVFDYLLFCVRNAKPNRGELRPEPIYVVISLFIAFGRMVN